MDTISDTYYSIAESSEGLFKDNGSRFIALAYPVETETQVKNLVEAARKKYHDARHHCFAYRIGHDGAVWRASDDGEPSGSAGRQILGQIDSAGLKDVAVIVVRYFGGIKLGIPGLIRAYKSSTADALQNAVRVEKTAGRNYSLAFSYEDMPAVMKALKDLGLQYSDTIFADTCRINVRVRLSMIDSFLEKSVGNGRKIHTFID